MTAPEQTAGHTNESGIKTELFGERGSEAFNAAITACHEFAQATGCPAGGDVVSWFDGKMEQFRVTCQLRFDEALLVSE